MTSTRRGARKVNKPKKNVEETKKDKPAPKPVELVPEEVVAEDSDDFVIDRTPLEKEKLEKIAYTKKQQAALDKLARTVSEDDPITLPAPVAPKVKKLAKLRQPVPRKLPIKSKQPATGNTYDLWEKDFVAKVDHPYEAAGEHFLRFTKQKMPHMPATIKHKPSILDAVAIPEGGASYNPTADDYHEYVSKIATEEVAFIEKEERIEQSIKPKHEAMATHRERYLEQTEGLVIDPRYNDDAVDGERIQPVDGEKTEVVQPVIPSLDKRKTIRQRATMARVKKEERERLQKKHAEKHQHDVYKARNINKRLAQQEVETVEEAHKRKKQKVLNKLTKRQRLGRGEFEEEEAPFLLEEELSGNLRQLRPQGSVLSDRMKSLQKRNILPIGGEKNKKRLKKALKVKYVEKRNTKDVVKGTRVI